VKLLIVADLFVKVNMVYQYCASVFSATCLPEIIILKDVMKMLAGRVFR